MIKITRIVQSIKEPSKRVLWLNNGILKYFGNKGWAVLREAGNTAKIEDKKAVKYTENGTFEIAPSDGYDAIKGAEVKVEVTKPVEKFVVPDGMKFGFSTNIDTNKINVSNVTDMSRMFSQCNALTSLDTSQLCTSSASSMKQMFSGCSNLITLDVSNFDTSKVASMEGMFNACYKITQLDLSNFNTSEVLSVLNMFNSCYALESLDLSNFDTSKVTIMNNMFYQCQHLTFLDLSSFDTICVTAMSGILTGCSRLSKLVLSSKFFNSTSLTIYDFSGATAWTEETSLATLVDALPQLTKTKTIKLSTNTKNALTDEQKTTITGKGWTIA